MKKIVFVLIIFISNVAEAQFIKEKAINAQIGYAISIPYNSVDEVVGDGLFVQGELVLKAYSWLELRPYAGLILTNANDTDINNNPTHERVASKAFLLGGKVRVRAPIPWVAPYIEIGLGGSIGKFETLTAFDTVDKSGFIHHIPFSLGLELGKNNNVDLGLVYYIQPTAKQTVGAFAVGITIPLKSK